MATEIFIGDAVFCAAIGFLAGALAAGLGWNAGSLIFAAAFFGSCFYVLVRGLAPRARVFLFALFFVPLLAGFFYFFLFTAMRTRATHLPFGKSTSFTAIVSDEPKESANYLLLDVVAEAPLAGTLTVFAPLGANFHYGDEVKVAGVIEAPKTPGDSPAAFPRYIKGVGRHKGFWLQEDLIDFKAAILEKFNEVLPGDEAALIGGETLGGMNGMSADLKEQMSASGTSYVVSMYGYKISLIIFFLEAALGELLPRRLRFLVLAIAIILFVMMSGGNVSAVRAAIMAFFALAAKLAGRSADPRNTLTLTAFGMALFDPTLPAQAGFELSFWSIVGMFYLVGPLARSLGWHDRDKGFLGWREAIIVAVASLLPIVPILIAAFGNFGLSAFPSNTLISVAVLPALLLGSVIALLGCISHYLAFLVAKLASVLMLYQFAVIKIFATISLPLPIPFNSLVAFAIYYGALAWFAYKYHEQ